MATAICFPADTRPAFVEFSLLESWLASSSALQLPLHQIESQQQAKGREVQRLLLQAHLQHRGNGDIGPALQLGQADGAMRYSHRRLSSRSLTTVFGTVELVRMGYSRPGAPSIFPLDKALALPARSFSYELQRRLVKAAVQNPFLESVQTIAELTGVAVSKRSLEEILPDAARDFDAFYQQRSVATAAGSILVAAVDGKGIPMVKPCSAPPRAGLTKGQKANQSSEWPRWLPSSLARLGCEPHNKLSKACEFAQEGSLEADLRVLDRTLRILCGEVGQVVKGIRQSITKRGLSGPKCKILNAVANYLYRNRSRMRYNEYLANGWPIASGPVEGACKNLIKDRMERSGMRWTEQMAEAIVQL
jgi:hypothetical protein